MSVPAGLHTEYFILLSHEGLGKAYEWVEKLKAEDRAKKAAATESERQLKKQEDHIRKITTQQAVLQIEADTYKSAIASSPVAHQKKKALKSNPTSSSFKRPLPAVGDQCPQCRDDDKEDGGTVTVKKQKKSERVFLACSAWTWEDAANN